MQVIEKVIQLPNSRGGRGEDFMQSGRGSEFGVRGH